jgi:uncharacterized protein (TIGR03000 family)
MRSVPKVVAVAAGVIALAAWLGVQPGQAKEYPDGYDPASGWTWDEDFRYNPATNPFGYRGANWDAWQGNRPAYGYYVPYTPAPAGYYYGSPPYANMPGANYSYGAYAGPAARDNLARLRVIVPGDAKVWFAGKATRQGGAERRFESPALTPGRSYSYDVKAQWRDKDGKEVTRTRHVDVSANSDRTVDFTRE